MPTSLQYWPSLFICIQLKKNKINCCKFKKILIFYRNAVVKYPWKGSRLFYLVRNYNVSWQMRNFQLWPLWPNWVQFFMSMSWQGSSLMSFFLPCCPMEIAQISGKECSFGLILGSFTQGMWTKPSAIENYE